MWLKVERKHIYSCEYNLLILKCKFKYEHLNWSSSQFLLHFYVCDWKKIDKELLLKKNTTRIKVFFHRLNPQECLNWDWYHLTTNLARVMKANVAPGKIYPMANAMAFAGRDSEFVLKNTKSRSIPPLRVLLEMWSRRNWDPIPWPTPHRLVSPIRSPSRSRSPGR